MSADPEWFWPDEFARQNAELRHTMDYTRFIGGSEAITAVPGEAMYWPSDYWHVGESEGAFSVTWGLGYWLVDGMRRLALEEAAAALGGIRPETPCVRSFDLTNPAQTLAAIQRVLADVREAVSREHFDDGFVRGWLEHYSAFGFLRVPAPVEYRPWDSMASVRRKPPLPILASPLRSGALCVASAGRSRLFPADDAVLAVIERLNADQPVSVAQWCYHENGAVRDLIEFCLGTGGLIGE